MFQARGLIQNWHIPKIETHGRMMIIPSGYVKIAIENGPFIVDLPIKHCDFPWFFVSLGAPHWQTQGLLAPSPIKRCNEFIPRIHSHEKLPTSTSHYLLVGGLNHPEKYEFVNGFGMIPYMKWKIIQMFQTTNQFTKLPVIIVCRYEQHITKPWVSPGKLIVFSFFVGISMGYIF